VNPAPDQPEGNPFSTRHVRPGAIDYLFPPGTSPASLLARLEENSWRGQIVGPHGSGKSALLATLVRALEASRRRVHLVELHDGQRRMPRDFRRSDGITPDTLVVVDGYEQLGFFSRFRLRRFCGKRALGLLVTAHSSVGFPDLFRTAPDVATTVRLVERLVERDSPISADEIRERFALHEGDLREVFFDLYDVYERRRCRRDDFRGSDNSPPTAGS
jgi:hypothetical protein